MCVCVCVVCVCVSVRDIFINGYGHLIINISAHMQTIPVVFILLHVSVYARTPYPHTHTLRVISCSCREVVAQRPCSSLLLLPSWLCTQAGSQSQVMRPAYLFCAAAAAAAAEASWPCARTPWQSKVVMPIHELRAAAAQLALRTLTHTHTHTHTHKHTHTLTNTHTCTYTHMHTHTHTHTHTQWQSKIVMPVHEVHAAAAQLAMCTHTMAVKVVRQTHVKAKCTP